MTAHARPQWFRLDNDFVQNPKIVRLRMHRKDAALWLYLDSIGYANSHLTDGWVPPEFPPSRGYKKRDIDALEGEGLWHPMQITDIGGWLIHDYITYQPTKDYWTRKSEQRSAAARARWEKR